MCSEKNMTEVLKNCDTVSRIWGKLHRFITSISTDDTTGREQQTIHRKLFIEDYSQNMCVYLENLINLKYSSFEQFKIITYSSIQHQRKDADKLYRKNSSSS